MLRKPTKKSINATSRITKARLAGMIEEATVDAYGDSERLPAGTRYSMNTLHCRLKLQCSAWS